MVQSVVQSIWHNSYPPNVPHQLSQLPSAGFNNLVELFEHAFQHYGESIAFSNFGTQLTYQQLEEQSRHFAAYLQSLPHLKPGDRVGLMMPNALQYPIAMLGVLRAGFVVVNVNPLYTAHELAHTLHDSGAKVLVACTHIAPVVQQALALNHETHSNKTANDADTCPVHIVLTRITDMHPFLKRWAMHAVLQCIKKIYKPYQLPHAETWFQVMAKGQAEKFHKPSLGPQHLAFLQYTGGTTGVAKGAMLSHGNMVANVMQATAWLNHLLRPAQEVIITALPMYHIFCLTANVLVFMHVGGHCLLITDPRNMKAFVKTLAAQPFTAITGVNTLFNGLLNTPGFAQVDCSELRMVLGGGAAIEPSVAQRWHAVTGIHLTQAYGLTEASPAVCINIMNSPYNGSIGLPIPSTQVRIVNDQDIELPLGEVGELCVKGPQVMQGYWNRPRETAEVLTADGWLRTGDMAHMDANGYVYITDRKKDMILVSGFNVYPNEIEAVATLHAGVLEAAAVGVDDEKTGQAVKLFVVRKASGLTETQLAETELTEHLRRYMTSYKIPKSIVFVDALPKSPVGKVLRRQLR